MLYQVSKGRLGWHEESTVVEHGTQRLGTGDGGISPPGRDGQRRRGRIGTDGREKRLPAVKYGDKQTNEA
ncbi:hypothetical protein VTN49DRAFT_6882 [Thermomyces lanuginosus]|uniref:uncharacterized protein n=1 Tax=Thermomyces lanuginosus TaxID=5541 RepID=UPI00374496BD